jgi:hypothetical protein
MSISAAQNLAEGYTKEVKEFLQQQSYGPFRLLYRNPF